MYLTVVLLNIIFVLMCVIFLILLKMKCLKSNKISNDLVGFISRSSEILTRYEKKQESVQLRNSIKLYSLIRVILKIVNPDYISFFKYNYNQYNEQEMSFLFSVDSDGIALQNSYLEKIPTVSNILKLAASKKNDGDIDYLYSDDIEDKNDDFYQVLLKRNISKVYFKSVYNSKDEPVGLILLSYKNKEHVLSDDDKNDALKIIEETKNFI